jgi:hypothetical protein
MRKEELANAADESLALFAAFGLGLWALPLALLAVRLLGAMLP